MNNWDKNSKKKPELLNSGNEGNNRPVWFTTFCYSVNRTSQILSCTCSFVRIHILYQIITSVIKQYLRISDCISKLKFNEHFWKHKVHSILNEFKRYSSVVIEQTSTWVYTIILTSHIASSLVAIYCSKKGSRTLALLNHTYAIEIDIRTYSKSVWDDSF